MIMIEVERFEILGDRYVIDRYGFPFKCEKATNKDIPIRYLKKLRKMGFEPIRVPIRQQGITSEGEHLRCHANVMRVVERFDGYRLQGHQIKKSDYKGVMSIKSFDHSVWVTPEMEITCVTKSNYDESILEKGYIVFLPRVIDEGRDEFEVIKYFDFMWSDQFFSLVDNDGELYKHNGDKGGLNIQSDTFFAAKNDGRLVKELMNLRQHYNLESMYEGTSYLSGSR